MTAKVHDPVEYGRAALGTSWSHGSRYGILRAMMVPSCIARQRAKLYRHAVFDGPPIVQKRDTGNNGEAVFEEQSNATPRDLIRARQLLSSPGAEDFQQCTAYNVCQYVNSRRCVTECSLRSSRLRELNCIPSFCSPVAQLRGSSIHVSFRIRILSLQFDLS
jgi:hypothetical protein